MVTAHTSLKRSIRNLLVKRLLVAGGLIAIAVGAGAWYIERDRVGDALLEDAKEAAQAFTQQAGSLLKVQGGEELQANLQKFLDSRVRKRIGQSADVRIYDTQSMLLAQVRAEDFTAPQALRGFTDTPIPPKTEGVQIHQLLRVDGQPHLAMVAPLTAREGTPLGFANVVFVVSPDKVKEVEKRALRSALAAIIVVLLTTLVLYPIVMTLVGRISRLSSALLESNLEMLKVLGSAIAKRDSDTDVHNFRVSIYSVRIAEAMGLSDKAIQGLIKGAFLHDVGKIGITDNILLKPGPLNDEEFTVMKVHVGHGVDIVERANWLVESIDVVHGHHEKFDGSGYPQGLVGQKIPINARIFAVADVFDALTSKRPYKEPFPFAESMNILEEGRGTHFDPEVLDVWASIAQRLHGEFANREDQWPQQELERITERYFSEQGLSALET